MVGGEIVVLKWPGFSGMAWETASEPDKPQYGGSSEVAAWLSRVARRIPVSSK